MLTLTAFCSWAIGASSAGIIGNLSTEGAKKIYGSFKEKFNKYYDSDEQLERHFESMCNEEAANPKKPNRDIEDSYEKITGKEYVREFEEELKEWVLANKELFNDRENMAYISGNISSIQHASTIYNNVGSQTINNGK